MSLTSIMKSDFSKTGIANIPIPKDKFKPSQNCIICPKTKNYALIGTAFDYLLRSELKRLHPKAKETKTIADISIEIVNDFIEDKGYLQCINQKIGKLDRLKILYLAVNYEAAREEFMPDGILTDNFLELTIRYARMDAISRAKYYDDVEKIVDPLDIDDMRNLYSLIPREFKESATNILLDPTFRNVLKMVGGANLDFIMGNTMIDIKTTREMKLNEYYWSQIVGYLMLATEAHKRYKSFPKIENIGLYFSRYGYLWEIEADYVRNNPNYEQVKKELLDLHIKNISKNCHVFFMN